MERLLRVLLALCRVVVPMLAGSALAILLVPLWAPWTQSHWVATFEAIGTWVGGLATVLALIWAVRVFRSERDMTTRELEQQAIRDAAELQAKEAAAAEALAAKVERAALVTVDVTRGDGYGVDPNALLTHVNLQWRNQTDAVVYIQAVRPDPPFVLRQPFTRTIAAHRGGFDAAIIEPLGVAESDLRNNEKLGALVQYMLDGVRWTRHTVTDTAPKECVIDDHPHAIASKPV